MDEDIAGMRKLLGLYVPAVGPIGGVCSTVAGFQPRSQGGACSLLRRRIALCAAALSILDVSACTPACISNSQSNALAAS